MKITFFLGIPVTSIGPAWVRIGSFASFLSNKGHDVKIISGLTFSYKRNYQNISGVKIVSAIFHIEAIHNLFRFISFPLSFLYSSLIVLLLNPDILVVSMPPGEPAIGAIMVCKILRKRLVFDYRDLLEDIALARVHKKRNWIAKTFWSFTKKLMTLLILDGTVVTVTSALVKDLKKRGMKKLWLIPNGADTKVFRIMKKIKLRENLALSDEDFIIVFIGYIGIYYRLDVVVKAISVFMKRYNINNIRLNILGFGPEIKKVLRLGNILGISENINYLGCEQNRQQIAEIIACADVGIIPLNKSSYRKKAYPVKFFEYGACGLPVIATIYADSLLARLINRYKIGVIVPPLDVEELVLAIKRMYFEKEFRDKAGRSARKLIEERFDRNRLAAEFETLIQSI